MFAIAAVLIGLILCVSLLIKKRKGKAVTRTISRLKRTGVVLGGLVVILFGFSMFSQFTAKTPPILNGQNKVLEGSIAELTRLELNGRKEWISIRGDNILNPVLLFLAGGPGGSQMAAVRHDLGELEKHFVVVNWDQPGSGKSYSVVLPFIKQHLSKGFSMCIYDFKYPDLYLDNLRNDEDINKDIQKAFRRNMIFDDNKVSIEVLEGIVKLTGVLPNTTARREAYNIALYTAGVREVDNSITIGNQN